MSPIGAPYVANFAPQEAGRDIQLGSGNITLVVYRDCPFPKHSPERMALSLQFTLIKGNRFHLGKEELSSWFPPTLLDTRAGWHGIFG